MDKLGLMASFVAVVESGSFTSAAERLCKTKAVISRQVQQLEDLLQIRLLNRTTRTLSVTEEGRLYYQRCKQILDDVSALESDAAGETGSLRGTIRVAVPQTFGEMHLMRVLPEFLQRHPDLDIDLHLSDRFVDLVGEGFDLAIRISQLQDSSMVARKLSESRVVLVASREFARTRGLPEFPEALADYPCIFDSNWREGTRWRFRRDAEEQVVRISSRLAVNSAFAAREAALAGIGIANVPDFAVSDLLASGELVQVLADYSFQSSGVYAIFPHRRHLSLRVRTLVDYLAQCWSEEN
ncbi:LysR family transcriptional regulator [Marinobacterium jannaschii]|uniref:LysR family transcriptional regulator n=1 Tax=Marinobacterium jannaschii TaxID=64970 RepID=UPI00048379BA|nr:LysR family transcriptional regulator [Marinobacterium jannaschii]